MSILGEVKEEQRERNKPDTRVVQVKEYMPSEQPENWTMKAVDLFNKDDNGVPKEYTVSIVNDNPNVLRVNDFANNSSMSHTQVGGIIRLDRAIERADGSLVARHAQRLCKDDSCTRQDKKMEISKIGIDRNWVKVLPAGRGPDGRPKEYTTAQNGRQHRGFALVIPEQMKEVSAVSGQDDLKAKFREAAELAINEAPEKTRPMVRLRVPEDNNVVEAVIQTLKRDDQGNYQEMTHNEKIEAFFNNGTVSSVLQKASAVEGVEMHMAAGYRANVFGTTLDFQTNQPLEKSSVEEMLEETQRRITRPDPDKPNQVKLVSQQPEYVLSVTSIEIPHLDPRGNPSQRNGATLSTLQRIPGVVASPVGHPDHVTENPYQAEWDALRNPAGQPAATQGSAMSPQQAAYQAQAPDNRQAASAAQAAPANEAPAPIEDAGEPVPGNDTPAESAETATTAADPGLDAQADAQADMALDELPDDDWNGLDDGLDPDELESQLGLG